ncbi:hypothetical protein GDO81_011178 [Engystomops pustulosus]|uniref:Secreted protein n=1 Tax=Engystomops pustulosus TaxID=76066 RepID=A0AAV7BCF2_ENGPU|nr:hypothetical protein GDO81_011178 [Engystomops pustulosus]
MLRLLMNIFVLDSGLCRISAFYCQGRKAISLVQCKLSHVCSVIAGNKRSCQPLRRRRAPHSSPICHPHLQWISSRYGYMVTGSCTLHPG